MIGPEEPVKTEFFGSQREAGQFAVRSALLWFSEDAQSHSATFADFGCVRTPGHSRGP
jgi:hypothetical protein